VLSGLLYKWDPNYALNLVGVQPRPVNVTVKIDRATIVNHSSNSMPPRKRGRKRSSGASTVRLSKGRVVIKVGGFPGTQRLAPAQLIRKIAKKHIKKAATSILRGTKKTVGRKNKGGKRKKRKVRKSKRKRTRKKVTK